MIDADFAIIHAGQLTCVQAGGTPRELLRGSALAEPDLINNGAVAARDGRIVWVGPTDAFTRSVKLSAGAVSVDADGRVVTPGLIDAHTHPVFAGSRAHEFEMRAAGKSYLDIARAGGGIANSVRMMRETDPEVLLTRARHTADRMLAMGTTTAEAKSGYGLDRENELKMLRVIRSIDEFHAIDWIPTALPAHTIPPEHREKPDVYAGIVADEILPAIASEKLAEFSDIFIEDGAFTLAQAEHIQGRAATLGFALKFHVDQLSAGGGTELALSMNAVSVDHLEHISDEGIRRLAGSDTIGVMLPGCAYFLDQSARPPVRQLIDAGAALAVATDYNPGSNMSESMPLALNQACVLYKMTPAEALNAATRNAAFAVGRGRDRGAIATGQLCDLVVWDTDDYRDLSYHYGVNLASIVVKRGRVVVQPQARPRS